MITGANNSINNDNINNSIRLKLSDSDMMSRYEYIMRTIIPVAKEVGLINKTFKDIIFTISVINSLAGGNSRFMSINRVVLTGEIDKDWGTFCRDMGMHMGIDIGSVDAYSLPRVQRERLVLDALLVRIYYRGTDSDTSGSAGTNDLILLADNILNKRYNNEIGYCIDSTEKLNIITARRFSLKSENGDNDKDTSEEDLAINIRFICDVLNAMRGISLDEGSNSEKDEPDSNNNKNNSLDRRVTSLAKFYVYNCRLPLIRGVEMPLDYRRSKCRQIKGVTFSVDADINTAYKELLLVINDTVVSHLIRKSNLSMELMLYEIAKMGIHFRLALSQGILKDLSNIPSLGRALNGVFRYAGVVEPSRAGTLGIIALCFSGLGAEKDVEYIYRNETSKD